ncbi:hypothetical protein [Bacillus sp. FSL R5-0286]
MTLQHYIGSNKELPLGTIGQNPTYKPFSELTSAKNNEYFKRTYRCY